MRSNIKWVLIIALLVIIFDVFYVALNGPDASIVIPVVTVVSVVVMFGLVLSKPTPAQQYLELKERLRGENCVSKRNECKQAVLAKHENTQGPERSQLIKNEFSMCDKETDRDECTDQLLESCNRMLRDADPVLKEQFLDMSRTKPITETLNLCTRLADPTGQWVP